MKDTIGTRSKIRFCAECKHYSKNNHDHKCWVLVQKGASWVHWCAIAPIIKLDHVWGVQKTYVLCENRNRKMDCPFFEIKEISETEKTKNKHRWQFWRR